MQLHEVPNGSFVALLEDARIPPAHRDVSEYEMLWFCKIDGMYSLCYDDNGERIHIAAWTEVEIVSPIQADQITHTGCMNWPNCDSEGCGEGKHRRLPGPLED
jgi:hypothetical protein